MLIQKEGDVDIRLGDVAQIEIGTTELNNLDPLQPGPSGVCRGVSRARHQRNRGG